MGGGKEKNILFFPPTFNYLSELVRYKQRLSDKVVIKTLDVGHYLPLRLRRARTSIKVILKMFYLYVCYKNKFLLSFLAGSTYYTYRR